MFCRRKRSTAPVASRALAPAMKRRAIRLAPVCAPQASKRSVGAVRPIKANNGSAPGGSFNPGLLRYSLKWRDTWRGVLSAGSASTKRNNSTLSDSSAIVKPMSRL